jgi:glycosyltransferase involved in cell wall biosynthesis
MIKLNCLFPLIAGDGRLGHIFLSLCRGWQGPEVEARMVVPSAAPDALSPQLVESIPRLLRWYYYRDPDMPRNLTGKRFLKDMKNFDAAYIWPDAAFETLQAVKRMDKPLFLERINCYVGEAKHILDDAYAKLGVQPNHSITLTKVRHELMEMSLADFVFCPSPEVKRSFQEAGVPEEKLLLTSYGWSPARFPDHAIEKSFSQEEVTVIFVGFICVRKGAHLLLRAWEKAGIKGRLVLCGEIEPVIAEICKDILGRSDVLHQPYNWDMSAAYRSADIFAFPSLEEGSPLVAYEALAHGLPILTSPMGSGGVVRDGIDGLIISPYDQDALIEGLRALANSPALRQCFSMAARQQAKQFTWQKVAHRRADQLSKKMASLR